MKPTTGHKNDWWKGHKKTHEWGVVAQTHGNYREFWQCQLCGKFCECGDTSKLWTPKQFDEMAKGLPMYHADSDDPWGSY